MARITLASVSARIDAQDSKFDRFESMLATLLERTEPAAPQSVQAPVTPKAPKAVVASEKVYRSAKGKEAAKAEVTAAWETAKAKAGVKRVKDLSPAQRAAVDAQVKAIWAAVPKTRTTKA